VGLLLCLGGDIFLVLPQKRMFLFVLGDSHLTLSGRIMVFAGALSFYFSDVFVARDRFLDKEFLNRLIGLPMYYTGQFLLAFSVGVLR